ncbi:alpha/beta-type small acid-soluble spore protein [Clostridium tetani]|uniref:alpha/beta-type small acid-soluble spore protein n=1 Tax=Clostridium tetani TaxID=1513 RepID=UPI00100B93C3|nr:alpha/beta-type small acid-soluble spore protein [Clostridium tetani]RXM57772.1 hypothetical protein DP133_08485 [Clostridium tetani]RXM75537.1 hypothetical protein DP154_09250 [Clostridium tetani]RYU98780.1 hypothetical protein DP144_09255 [Clostridium tetani]
MARNRILVPSAKGKLDEFKMEVARDMAIEYKELQNNSSPQSISKKIGTFGNIGGEMVRRMITEQEKKLID